MTASRSAIQAEQRLRMIDIALRRLEEHGVDALRARELSAEVGASTQALYTLFGGMPGLLEAVVEEGFLRLAAHVDAVPESDDPVADHLVHGWVYVDWALAHPQLYRLMFGVSDPGPRPHSPVEVTLAGAHLTGGGRTALDVLIRSVERMSDAGRIRPGDPMAVARQFISATHGYVLLEIAGAFGPPGSGIATAAELAINLLDGLGDRRDVAEQSFATAAAVHDRLAGPA